MIVETDTSGQVEAWVVNPCAGYALKFKDVELDSGLCVDKMTKLFVNVCHCSQLPPPLDDLDEDQVAAILDSDNPSSYRIPMSVGDLECIRDNKGDNAAKVDVVVNSSFFAKRLQNNDFFRHLLLLVTSEAISNKHAIRLDSKKAIRLKNRKAMGELSTQRIRKRPDRSVIQEVHDHDDAPPESATYDVLTTPKNYQLLVQQGKQLQIKLKLPYVDPPVHTAQRLRVRLNDDHVLVIQDRACTVADFYLPLDVDPHKATVQLIVEQRTLLITAPLMS